MARSKTSAAWLKEHVDDVWVQKAQKDGYRSRATYKLAEIDDKDRLLRSGMTVIDLGSAPGGWSQLLSERLGGQGTILASDILPMDPLPDVQFIQGDFMEDEVLQQLLDAMQGRQADLVISDMAPNLSGMNAIDQPRAMYLVELALDLAEQVLKPGGDFLAKVFQGEGYEDYLKLLRSRFDRVVTRKPEASRARSREVYLLARGFKG
ncbi:23S rRNA (uridine(2552)-2'-O)-methyltransferase RlmE [Marinospirillum alkaliphilum]|uniref:Ribosomal RNA large subunit methyltransferase E n=1 Tax=Marinospirillum alkaliphilum DSM 21637 TaxID=1122209 RepID=A0A1K1Y5R6_9GAMM|nr:23S rRNA (uridine(2552)-2'-O)-methyltransferase RlmE [Marinospirillum alkaliphilum]SFX57346.1 23S rRNA Um-2552 2'-O-methyltransferase [Marinospirillum alkaliphilum DSM 21637]